MAVVEGMLMSLPSDTLNANVVKDIVIYRLWKEGVITEEQADEYQEKWGIVIVKNGWFRRWVDKFKKEKNDWEYRFIKLEEDE